MQEFTCKNSIFEKPPAICVKNQGVGEKKGGLWGFFKVVQCREKKVEIQYEHKMLHFRYGNGKSERERQ